MKRSLIAFLAVGTVAGWVITSKKAEAASATASIAATVFASIDISKTSDLDFGSAAQGTGAVTVAPGNAENAQNASFHVTGGASQTYTITLPTSDVTLTHSSGGGADKEIIVNDFQSSPSSTGTLDNTGAQDLFVGATRAALGATQTPGVYSGTFSVTVAY